jgi:hypothetical protein
MTTVKTTPPDQPPLQFDPSQAVRLRDTSTELLEDAELRYVPPFADNLDKLDVSKGFLIDMALKRPPSNRIAQPPISPSVSIWESW